MLFLLLYQKKKRLSLENFTFLLLLINLKDFILKKRVQKYINHLGLKIAKVTERKVPYKFYVVNSNIINAFALPGGPVIITRGLFLQLDNESQLVGILAHELGHINARHHVKFLEKQLALSVIFQKWYFLLLHR